MIPFDYTWKNPSKEQAELARMFSSQATFPKGIKPRQCFEFIAFAEYSLWYLEIKRYTDGTYPLDISKDPIRFFMEGCNNICSLVEKGYDPELDGWWRMKAPVTDEEWKAANRFFISIANALNTLKLSYAGQALICEMFEVLARIILGNDWNEKFLGIVHPENAKKNHKKPASKGK